VSSAALRFEISRIIIPINAQPEELFRAHAIILIPYWNSVCPPPIRSHNTLENRKKNKLSYNLIMTIFEIEYITEFGGIIPVGKLIRNKKNPMAKLEDSIQKDSLVKREWPALMASLHDMSNRLSLPESRCRKLRLRTCPGLSVFELKSRHLRLYVMREDFTGIIMTLGGRKTEQKSDIQSLQKIILEYCQYRMTK
jgi:hypothetical protein